MRKVLKFQESEKFYLEDLTEVIPTETDEIINVTKENSVIDGFTLIVDNSIELDIYPKQCEFTGELIYSGHLVNYVVVSCDAVDAYCQSLGHKDWDAFINTETLENIETKELESVYISEADREKLFEAESDTFTNENGTYEVNYEDLEDATTDDSYYTEWDEVESGCFYLSNGLFINTFESEDYDDEDDY